MKLSDYELDPTRLQGVWWDFATASTCKGNVPTPGSGCFFIVPLIGNDGFTSAMDAGLARIAGTLRDETIPEEQKRDLRRQVWATATARHILRGWAGWDDLPASFDEARAIEILSDRRWLAVAEFVARACGEQRAAMVREEEQAKGN